MSGVEKVVNNREERAWNLQPVKPRSSETVSSGGRTTRGRNSEALASGGVLLGVPLGWPNPDMGKRGEPLKEIGGKK
jgi:hypothetical protein